MGDISSYSFTLVWACYRLPRPSFLIWAGDSTTVGSCQDLKDLFLFFFQHSPWAFCFLLSLNEQVGLMLKDRQKIGKKLAKSCSGRNKCWFVWWIEHCILRVWFPHFFRPCSPFCSTPSPHQVVTRSPPPLLHYSQIIQPWK